MDIQKASETYRFFPIMGSELAVWSKEPMVREGHTTFVFELDRGRGIQLIHVNGRLKD